MKHFSRSERALERAESVIPLGSQTFSKSRIQLPVGHAPLVLSRGEGCHVWDVDGNSYIDLVSGLLCVLLGYKDADVDAAIRAQLDRGISFSLATELEADLAERLIDLVPCAQMVRFGKNGTDATSACVRLARAVTRRDRVIVCGYHGWQDWYIGATSRNYGVPKAVADLTTKIPYNDLSAIEKVFDKHPDEVACVLLEPLQGNGPADGYLECLKALCHKNGTLLVFDEIISGFRIANGGAQAHFGITPDIAAFGKGMGNGMPISAVVGRADYMQRFEDVFFSGTFGGEALSLAAAIATIDKITSLGVVDHLWRVGGKLAEATRRAVEAAGLEETVTITGLDPWRIVGFRDHFNAPSAAIKTAFMCECFAGGVMTNGAHNLSFAHSDAEVDTIVAVYARAFEKIADGLRRNRLVEELPTAPVQPVFRVRG